MNLNKHKKNKTFINKELENVVASVDQENKSDESTSVVNNEERTKFLKQLFT